MTYVTTYTYDWLDHLTTETMPRPSGTQALEDASQGTTYYYLEHALDASCSHYTQWRLAAIQYYGGHCTSLGPAQVGRLRPSVRLRHWQFVVQAKASFMVI